MNITNDKNDFLQFRNNNSSFVSNNEIIEPWEVMRDLGAYVPNDLTWSTQLK